MRIKAFGKDIDCALDYDQSLALYAVPEDYSEDGFFLALWRRDELEPIPASGSFSPLLRLEYSSLSGEPELVEKFKAEGVSYAAN